ncbi:hypothetical protein [Lewinella sp. LCG006]|uniref:hypothetical protein n=1 Tax=Lewinella sp. LCG006 TaxID=3231911 RepID=UPI00345FCA86
MSEHCLSNIRLVALLVIGLIGSLGKLAAQVNMQFTGAHTGQVTEASVAHVEVMNFTGVEIHYHFKGYISTPDGQELLRVKSELLKHQPGSANFVEEHQGSSYSELNVDPFKNLKIQFAAPNWQNYSGPVNFRAELIHPLDTFSLIARTDQAVRLKNGQFVDEEGRFSTDPNLVKLAIEVAHDQQFEIDSLLDFVKLTNANPYPHCLSAPLVITIKQGQKDIYQLQYQHPCIGVGEQTLRPSDFKVLLDEYASRNRQKHIEIHFPRGDYTESTSVEAIQHAQYTDTKETFTSRALGLSFDHFEYAKVSAVPFQEGPTLIFDEQGTIVEVAPPAYRPFLYAMPIDYPLGFTVGRDDVNGNFSVTVFDWNSLSAAEWEAFFAGEQKKVIKQQVGNVEIWQSLPQEQVINDPKAIFPYQRFMLGIRDGNRFLMAGVTKVIVDRELPNYFPPTFSLDEVAFFASLRYHGIGFQPELDALGKLVKLKPYEAEKLTSTLDRQVVFNRYSAYATLPNLSEEAYSDQDIAVPSLSTLDRQLEERQESRLLRLPPITKITPDFDTIRHYATYEWAEADLTFEHRTSANPPMSTRLYEMFETLYFDNRDSIVSVTISKAPIEASAKPGLVSVAIAPSVLQMSAVSQQHIFIDHFINSDLTDGQLLALVAYECSNRAHKPAEFKKVTLGTWSVFASNSLVNPMRRFGTGNMVLVKTPKRIYRIGIIGGFESDILPFLNSLEIEGQQLIFEYQEDRGVVVRKK